MEAVVVAERLAGLAELVTPPAADRIAGPVTLREPGRERPDSPDEIFLAVGAARLDESLLTGPFPPSLVVVPHACAVDAGAFGQGVGVLRLRPGVPWLRVAAAAERLRAGTGSEAVAGDYRSVAMGDLFALANVVCRTIGAPVTIEDRNTNVLAFSDRQEETDSLRIASILRRTTPIEYHETSMDAELVSDAPVFVAGRRGPDGETVRPRTVIAVRHQGRLLGTIWAIVDGPLSAEGEAALTEAARVTALHLRTWTNLRDTAADQRLTAEMLNGGPGAAEAALTLAMTWPAVALAVRVGDPPAPGADLTAYIGQVAWRARLTAALTMHLRTMFPGCVATESDDMIHLAVGLGSLPVETVAERCRAFVAALSPDRQPWIGIGRVAHDVYELARARADADAAVQVLGSRTDRVGEVSELFVRTLLHDLRTSARLGDRGPSRPLRALLDYDRQRGAQLVATLRAWLDAFGDVPAAARACGVHPNTFRYRLARIEELAGVDLADPDLRFGLAFQLAVFEAA